MSQRKRFATNSQSGLHRSLRVSPKLINECRDQFVRVTSQFSKGLNSEQGCAPIKRAESMLTPYPAPTRHYS